MIAIGQSIRVCMIKHCRVNPDSFNTITLCATSIGYRGFEIGSEVRHKIMESRMSATQS